MGWVSKLFIGLGIAAAFILLFGAFVAFALYDESKPYVEREYPTELYTTSESCAPCNEVAALQTFSVTSGMNEVHASFSLTLAAAGGTARYVITDPSGDIRYDRTFASSTDARSFVDSPSWSAEQGEWEFTRTFTAMRGSYSVRLWGEGIPPGSLG